MGWAMANRGHCFVAVDVGLERMAHVATNAPIVAFAVATVSCGQNLPLQSGQHSRWQSLVVSPSLASPRRVDEAGLFHRTQSQANPRHSRQTGLKQSIKRQNLTDLDGRRRRVLSAHRSPCPRQKPVRAAHCQRLVARRHNVCPRPR